MGKSTNLSSLPLSSGSSLPLVLGPMSSPHWHSELLPVLSLSEQEASWWPSLGSTWLWGSDLSMGASLRPHSPCAHRSGVLAARQRKAVLEGSARAQHLQVELLVSANRALS